MSHDPQQWSKVNRALTFLYLGTNPAPRVRDTKSTAASRMGFFHGLYKSTHRMIPVTTKTDGPRGTFTITTYWPLGKVGSYLDEIWLCKYPSSGPISMVQSLSSNFLPMQISRTQLEDMQKRGCCPDHVLHHMGQTCHTSGGSLKVIPAEVHTKFHGALHLDRAIRRSTIDRPDFEQRRGRPAPPLG